MQWGSGTLDKLAQKTGIPCVAFKPLEGIDCSQHMDESLRQQLSASLAIALGLASRQPGDKPFPVGV